MLPDTSRFIGSLKIPKNPLGTLEYIKQTWTDWNIYTLLSVDACFRSVYNSSDLLVPHWLPLFPNWHLDHNLQSQTKLKGGLEFRRGRDRADGLNLSIMCVWSEYKKPPITIALNHVTSIKSILDFFKDPDLPSTLASASSDTYNSSFFVLWGSGFFHLFCHFIHLLF